MSLFDDYIKGFDEENKPFIVLGNKIASNRTSDKEEDDLMKHIRKRKDGRYEYRRTFNGKQYQCINRDRDTVRKFGAKINKLIKNLMSGLEEENNVTFAEYAEQYYHLFKEKKASESTKAEYETAHKYFKEHFNRPFRLISAEDFQRFLNKVSEETPTTALKLYNKISAICRKAFLTGIIKTNIGEIIDRPDVKYQTRRALTYDEQVAFLKELKKEPQDVQNFCLFCLVTSARREEAVRFEPSHLDLKRKTLFINGTKTLNAPRTIKVTDAFIKILKQIGSGFEHKGDYYSRQAKAIFEKIGSPDLVFNSLRHTCATNMVYLGVKPDFRKHVMGHSTIVTTDRVYTHIDVNVTAKDIVKLYGNLYFTDF